MMYSQSRFKLSFLALFMLFLFLSMGISSACKNIIATGETTEGEYNFLLKVRDPSRPGLQVLAPIPRGYEYTYHHPWTGKPLDFQVNHSYIGVASEQDTTPNIVKSGMVLTDAGIAYGDADSRSRWINPSPYAWDDFDWIRYSCEQADTETEAIHYLTTKAVDQLHATGVSENLCVVGPENGYLIEADAYRYTIKEIKDDVDVISNYPRELWKTQLIRSRFIADSYDTITTRNVHKGECTHLNGLARIRILDIAPQSVKVRQIPFFTNIGYHDGKPSFLMSPEIIDLGDSKTVGDFYVSILNISDNTATIRVTTAVYAWEQSMLDLIHSKKGNITIHDMMGWSRLQAEDVDDIRPMCEATYPFEGVAIYQIPQQNYKLLSKGWFSANHACSSIYVPFHNSNTAIFNKYKTGDAAKVSLALYQNFSDSLLPFIHSIEEVFITENADLDKWAQNSSYPYYLKAVVLTVLDTFMQEQAWIMSNYWLDLSYIDKKFQQNPIDSCDEMWSSNYSSTLSSLVSICNKTKSSEHDNLTHNISKKLINSICTCYITITEKIGGSVEHLNTLYTQGMHLLNESKYEEAATVFQQILSQSKQHFTLNMS